ncbi:MAG: leucine-rich repeat domain-containing protein, partial [Thermoguttaceae bacterium]
VVIAEGNEEIGLEAFKGCTSLTSVVIPKSVTKIKLQTFCGCTSLTSVVIPNPETEIDMWAFKDCPNLTIHAPKGSEAEKYARENKIPFQATE